MIPVSISSLDLIESALTVSVMTSLNSGRIDFLFIEIVSVSSIIGIIVSFLKGIS
jgi:hypothetical protein